MARMAYMLGGLACALSVGAATIAVVLGGSARGASTPHRSTAATSSTTAAANYAAGQADAASLLTKLALPTGSTESSSEPAGDGGVLSQSSAGLPTVPNDIDEHKWWLVQGAPADVLSYVQAHAPTGSTKVSSGYGSTGPTITSRDVVFEWPSVAGVLTTRWLVVTVAQLPDGSTALRADAEVVWVTPRPASEAIPPGTRLVRVSVHSDIKANQPAQRPFTVVSSKKIRAMLALLNALPLAQPAVISCPADFGIRVRLAFFAKRRAAPLSVVEIDPEGCGWVALTIGGRSQPPLASSPLPGTSNAPKSSLLEQLDRLLGVKLKIKPA